MKKLILIIILLIGSISLNAQIIAPTGTHSLQNTLQTLEVKCNIDKAYSLAYRTAAEFNWMINNSDSKLYAFSATTPAIMKRWDDKVNVYIDAVNDSVSIINVKSTLGHKPNIKYITLYLRNIEGKF